MGNILQTISETGYAKINLALDVTGRLDNGYHLVRMIMQSISLKDTLDIAKTDTPGIRLTCDLSAISVGQEKQYLDCGADNLIVKAVRAIYEETGIDENATGLEIHLTKRIPMAAGMAGGSTDAAAALRGINKMFQLGLSNEKLCEIGVKLGADIPYCIMGGSSLAEGIGEKLTPLTSPPQAHILIMKPNINVSTKYVYEHLDNGEVSSHPDVDGMIDALRTGDLSGITDRLGNVLRDVTVNDYGIVLELEEFMKSEGAMNALMSGSGPTVFGIFDEYEKCKACCELAHRMYSDLFIEMAEFV